jgi:hypothetical protein
MNEGLRIGDTLVVLAFDCAFRSVIDGLIALDDLTNKGIILESTSQRFDPTSTDGRRFFTLTMGVGVEVEVEVEVEVGEWEWEWEVNNLAMRTVEGLKAAVKRGK